MEAINGDLFATKGLEYLIVVGYLLLLVGFWRLMQHPGPARAASRAGQARRPMRRWFDVRDGVFFHQGHSWAAPDDGDLMRVGVDDFAQKLLGAPAAIELPPVGTSLRQGERGWGIRLDGHHVGMLSPVDGEVVEVNPAVQSRPGLVTSEPYDLGWLMKVRVPSKAAARKNLLSGPLARAWMDGTIEQLRAMRAGELGIVLPDGGFPVAGFARVLAPEGWDELARQFLMSD